MRARLGDDIDDFCVKCKRVMNHAVVSLVGEEPAKVRCRTCHSDHDYRHELPPPPKVDPRKAALFNQVLEKVAVAAPDAGVGVPAQVAMAGEAVGAAASEEAPVAEATPVKAARGRAKKA